jgi:predicted nucleotidyltransferase
MDSEIAQKLETFFRTENDVVAVYLFGSFATETHRKGSDVDIGILFDQINPDVQEYLFNQYLTHLPRLLRKDVHLVVLNRAGEELMRQIYSKGKLLVINDSKKLAQFNMVMVSKIVDFSYYRESIQKGFTKKLFEETV